LCNASKITTYADLIGPEHLPKSVFDDMRGGTIGASAVTVYLGLDRSPDELGITGVTTFISTEVGPEREYEMTKTLGFSEGSAMGMTCYTKMDPSFSPPGTTMAALITLQYADPWLQVPPSEYAKEKYRAADAIIKRAEQVYPGLKDHIEEMEISTPITHMRYLGHPGGGFYGFDQHMKDSASFVNPKPPIEGLYLAGAWVSSGGFQPTLDGGARIGRRLARRAKA